MTPRQRVLLAVNHQEPDRVPLALWGSWYGVTDKLYFKVLETLGWEPVAPFRPDRLHSVNYYDDRLLGFLNIDVRHVDPGAGAATSKIGADGTDGWGLKWRTAGLYRSASHYPLEQASVDEINRFEVPRAEEVIDAGQIQSRLKNIRNMTQEYAVAGRAVASYGFFEMAQSLRKHEQLLLDLAMAPDIVDALVDRLLACYSSLIGRFLDIAGEQLDLLELPGDDFAGNDGPLVSLEMFDRFFKNPYAQLIGGIKERFPDIKIVYHSDGAVTPFLSRLIEIGVDVFHPLEPLPAVDIDAVKSAYGQNLAFIGGIDIRDALQGSEADVIKEVKCRIQQLAPGGGYILAPANHLQWDIPPHNLLALFRHARELGKYPIA
jgi:uroporphyrinogen decarboxylase